MLTKKTVIINSFISAKSTKLFCLAVLVSMHQASADSCIQKTGKGLFHTAQAIGGLTTFGMAHECFKEFMSGSNSPIELLGIFVMVCSGCTLEREALLGFKQLFAKKTVTQRVCDRARQAINHVERRCC